MKIKAILLIICGLILTSCNSQTQPAIQTISATAFSDKIKAMPNAQLIDVRTPEEYAVEHLDNSKNINWNGDDFEEGVSKLDKSQPVFVYCKVGGRSLNAANKLNELGFKQIYNMDGGILKWNSAGLSKADKKQVGMTMQQYQKLIADKKVLVNFSAEWCAPCKKMKPYLLKMQDEMRENVTIVRLDADANKSLMAELKLDELPALLLYQNNELKWQHNGFIAEEELKSQLQ